MLSKMVRLRLRVFAKVMSLISIDNQKISDVKQFVDQVKKLDEEKAIPVLVQRGKGALFLALRIKGKE